MELSRNSPITIGTTAIPGSTTVCEFMTIGTKQPIKLDINTHIYRRHPVHRDTIDIITSDKHCKYTYQVEETHIIKMKIPQYERRDLFRSFVQVAMDQNEDSDIKVFVTNISIEESFKHDARKRKEEDERKIKEEQERLEDIIIASLPKDPINRIFYVKPLKNDSFSVISQHHIQYMRKDIKNENNKNIKNENNKNIKNENRRFEIVDIGWDQIGDMSLDVKRNILLHPFLYPFSSIPSFKKSSTVFHKLLKTKNKIGGFDVADSDRISFLATSMVNKLDLIIVPSNFAKNSFINSGVAMPVEILPYGISDEFLNNDSNTENQEIINLRKLKEKGNILILYFLAHSEYRKGADLVRDVINRIDSKFKNIYLIVKGPSIVTFSNIRSNVRVVQMNSWLNDNDLKCLYDTCDICLSPSRGGGFELNALEAISRGIPTLVTNGGCFLDYINYVIPISTNGKIVQPLPGNNVHTGFGSEADIDDFDTKLTDVISRLDYWKARFRENSEKVGKEYSWRNVVRTLEIYLKRYKFID